MKTTIATTQADVNVLAPAANVNASSAANESALIKKEVINKVSIMGHLGAAPEITELTSGMKKAKFRVATNRYFKNKQGEWQSETTWHNVIAWGKLALQAQKLDKGVAVSLDGRLSYRLYTDDKGQQRFYTEVIAQSITAFPRKEKEVEPVKIAA